MIPKIDRISRITILQMNQTVVYYKDNITPIAFKAQGVIYTDSASVELQQIKDAARLLGDKVEMIPTGTLEAKFDQMNLG